MSTFKKIYRRELIKKIVSNDRPEQESLKALNLKEIIRLAGKSWNVVSATSVEKCWMKGLATAFPAPVEAAVGIRNKDSDTDEDDEEFEGFTQADIDDMQKKIDASPEDI